jgi:predicted ATPase
MLEGFWVRNYKSLKQIGIGTCYTQFVYVDDETNILPYELGPVTLFTGANGTGKSSAVDVFTFISDCLLYGVDIACIRRGGFDAIYSQGGKGTLSFGFRYRQAGEADVVTYAVSIDCTKNRVPFVESELLAYRRGKESLPILFLQNGAKSIRYLAPDERLSNAELTQVEFTDYKHLGLGALESHPKFPVLASLRNLFENWVWSNFTPDPARGLDKSLPRRHDSPRGVSLSGLVRYVVNTYQTDYNALFQQISTVLPYVESIVLDSTEPEKPRLAFKMFDADQPIPMTLLSDATIRLFAYAILLEENAPAPLVVLEEPENGLDRQHCWTLMKLLHRNADNFKNSQVLVHSLHPGIADSLHPAQVWIFGKNRDGFTTVERADDSPVFQSAQEGETLDPQWFSNNFEEMV